MAQKDFFQTFPGNLDFTEFSGLGALRPPSPPGPPKNKEKIGPGPLKIGFLTPRGSRGGAGGPRSDFEKIKKIDFLCWTFGPS